MLDENIETEFAGTCRACGGNVDVMTDGDAVSYTCSNTKCEFSEGEFSDTEPEWVE